MLIQDGRFSNTVVDCCPQNEVSLELGALQFKMGFPFYCDVLTSFNLTISDY
jgi:hypothetical protein